MTNERKLYLARAGRRGEDEEYAIENDLAIIGFLDVPSAETTRDLDDVSKLVSDARPDWKPQALANFSSHSSTACGKATSSSFRANLHRRLPLVASLDPTGTIG